MKQQVKQYQTPGYARAAYAGAAGYAFVIISWGVVYEVIFLYLQEAYKGFYLIQQFAGIMALSISLAYVFGGWHLVAGFYAARRERVDQYPYKCDVDLYEDGHMVSGHMLIKEDGVQPFALYDKHMKLLTKNVPKRILLDAEEGALSTGDNDPTFIGYQITPNPEFELFDIGVFAVPVSWSRLMGYKLDEFPFLGVLVRRPTSPLSIVKIHRITLPDNRSIMVGHIGWSAFHAEMDAIDLKVSSVSDLDTVERHVLLRDPSTGVVSMQKVPTPVGAAMFHDLDMWKEPKLQETIKSRDASIEAFRSGGRDVRRTAEELKAEESYIMGEAIHPQGPGFHPLALMRKHKKASVVVVLVAISLVVLLAAEAAHLVGPR